MSYQTVILVFGAVLGGCAGSFFSCAAYRLPRRISLGGRSFCPTCGARLKARWNVPLLGWLALRGRAGCCGQPIGARYPLIELSGALAGAAVAVLLGVGGVAVLLGGLVGVCALASWLTASSLPPEGSSER